MKEKDRDPQQQLLTAVAADAFAVIILCLEFFTSLLTELVYSELRIQI